MKTATSIEELTLPTTGRWLVLATGDVGTAVLLHRLMDQSSVAPRLSIRLVFDGQSDSLDRQLVASQARIYGWPLELPDSGCEHQSPPTSGLMTPESAEDYLAAALATWQGGRPWATRRLLAPLSSISRQDLIDYARHHQLPWQRAVTDNDDLASTLSELDGQDRCVRLLTRHQRLERQIESSVRRLWRQLASGNRDDISLDRRRLAALNPSVLDRVLAQGLPQSDHFGRQQLIRDIKAGPWPRPLKLASGLNGEISYDRVLITFGPARR